MSIDRIAEQIGELVVNALKINFSLQGHKLTGSLNSSLEYDVVRQGVKARVDFYMLEYGLILNDGVKPNRIPYSPGSGAKSSKYIQGLTRYAQQRFFVGQAEAQRIAFAIARKHKKEGMPTKSSYQFSRNGKRLGAIDDAIEETSSEVNRLIELAIQEIFNNFLEKIA